jgi:hypothetical protein
MADRSRCAYERRVRAVGNAFFGGWTLRTSRLSAKRLRPEPGKRGGGDRNSALGSWSVQAAPEDMVGHRLHA